MCCYMHHNVDTVGRVADLNPTVCPDTFSLALLLVSSPHECLPRAVLLDHSQLQISLNLQLMPLGITYVFYPSS